MSSRVRHSVDTLVISDTACISVLVSNALWRLLLWGKNPQQHRQWAIEALDPKEKTSCEFVKPRNRPWIYESLWCRGMVMDL
jgi:hypothetical protein